MFYETIDEAKGGGDSITMRAEFPVSRSEEKGSRTEKKAKGQLPTSKQNTSGTREILSRPCFLSQAIACILTIRGFGSIHRMHRYTWSKKKEKERRRRRAGSVLNVYNISSIFSRRFLVCICSSFIFYFFFFPFLFLPGDAQGVLTRLKDPPFSSLLYCDIGLGAGAYCARPGLSTSHFFSSLPTFRDFFWFSLILLYFLFFPP